LLLTNCCVVLKSCSAIIKGIKTTEVAREELEIKESFLSGEDEVGNCLEEFDEDMITSEHSPLISSPPPPSIELINLKVFNSDLNTSSTSSIPSSLNYLSIDNRNRSESIEYDTIDRRGSPHHLHATIKDQPSKTIGKFGSFVLLVNNLTGPGMLGFPNLFQKAGILPVLGGIFFVFICASLCGTLLADSIASIPNNSRYDLQIDFSSAFRYTVGEDWYVVAETLFLISCVVQASAGIVETAQSLDGFIASFLLGKTYAIEFYPTLQFISWSPDLCHEETISSKESNLADCTPFHNAGTLVFTLGFLITTLIFLPLGRGHLKETIIVQIISFLFMVILLFQFSGEFVHRGLHYRLPW
jgi:hypothetical protein